MSNLTKWTTLLTIAAAAGCASVPSGMVKADFAGIVPQGIAGDLLEDSHVDELLARLDSLMNTPETQADLRRRTSRYLQGFRWWVGRGRVTPGQSGRITAYLAGAKTEHADAADIIDRQRHLFEILTPGQVAQNIVGTDIDRVEFELADYRGSIVVLVFSGDWCGPCRSEYPYQRSMLDLYKGEEVVLLGINSDTSRRTVREAKEREGLHYRTWWDGGTNGPISRAWNVRTWPSTFILDEEGVIRFTGKRKNGIILAVDQLLEETRAEDGKRDSG